MLVVQLCALLHDTTDWKLNKIVQDNKTGQKICSLVHTIRNDVIVIGITGSRSKGLNSEYSDIDIIYVVENTYFNRWFGFIDGKPIEIAFVNLNYLNNLLNRQMPPYRIYLEAGNFNNVPPLRTITVC